MEVLCQENRVVLKIASEFNHRGDLIIERHQETNPGWSLEFVPRFQRSCIEFQPSDWTIAIRLNLAFLVGEGQLLLWTAQMTSSPAAIGEDSARRAYQVGIVTEGAQ